MYNILPRQCAVRRQKFKLLLPPSILELLEFCHLPRKTVNESGRPRGAGGDARRGAVYLVWAWLGSDSLLEFISRSRSCPIRMRLHVPALLLTLNLPP